MRWSSLPSHEDLDQIRDHHGTRYLPINSSKNSSRCNFAGQENRYGCTSCERTEAVYDTDSLRIDCPIHNLQS